MLQLSEIQKAKGSSKTKKRVGRGNSSGHGTYSTRGLKGQKSRSGVSGLKRLGMRMQLLQTPKSRGFKSQKQKNQVISIKAINNNYKDGEIVSKDTLMEKGLILKKGVPVKILGKEKLTVKVTVEGLKMSESVATQLK
jgi:large subunit ribosomal protein L15